MFRPRLGEDPNNVAEADLAISGAHPRDPAGASFSPASEVAERLLDVPLLRRGRRTRFREGRPRFSGAAVQWRQIAVEDYAVPACLIERHEHPEVFLHFVLTGAVGYDVRSRGRSKRFDAIP